MSEVEKVVNELAATFASTHEAHGAAANVADCRCLAQDFADRLFAAQRADRLDVLRADNYADKPQTISELRGNKTGKATDWTPRDALLVALREIDSAAVKPEVMVVAFAERLESGAVKNGWYLGNTVPKFNRYVTVGLLHTTLHDVMNEP